MQIRINHSILKRIEELRFRFLKGLEQPNTNLFLHKVYQCMLINLSLNFGNIHIKRHIYVYTHRYALFEIYWKYKRKRIQNEGYMQKNPIDKLSTAREESHIMNKVTLLKNVHS